MLSRRNVRIKVMQMLYSMSRDKKLKYEDALVQYQKSIERSFELYLFNLLHYIRIAEYSIQDATRKLAKLLPSEEDKQFTAKLSENDLIQSIIKNKSLQGLYQKYRLSETIDEDNSRLVYSEFAKTAEYKSYIKQENSQYEDHKSVLLALYKYCLGHELFNELMEDNYPHWIDDKSLIVGAVKKTIKSLPASEEFYKDYLPSTEATVDFGEALLSICIKSDQDLRELIEPTLKNWDADRVAVIDMILLKMAICELMHFPTIPTKVTLNEFVEISKLYSTDKSKDFINGILDRLMKKLNKDGKINKEGRGLQE